MMFPKFSRLHRWLLRHELWALQTAKRVPVLAVFPVITLAVWPLVPALALSVPCLYLLSQTPKLGALVTAVVAGPFAALIAGWWGHWYLIAAGIMIGKPGMAERKAVALEKNLARLQATSG